MRALVAIWLGAVLSLAGCGGGTVADTANPTVDPPIQGATPFNATIAVGVRSQDRLRGVSFRIDPKPGASAMRPVTVRYAREYLERRGLIDAGLGRIGVAVFGLYAGRHNSGAVEVEFDDGSTATVPFSIDTPPYVDPAARYDRPLVRVARPRGAPLGFDYFYIKSALGPPIVVDTDGEPRWIGSGESLATTSLFRDNGFTVVDGLALLRIEFDGTSAELARIPTGIYTAAHHNLDEGKAGVLVELDASANGVGIIESILADVRTDGSVAAEWNFATILSRHMQRGGDDPTVLVRPGEDWFHMNAAAYDPRDDSIIVSSRENFVIKVDYASGEIIWIFGDPTKYWYSVPSLRAKSLNLASGLYPIGQHAVSLLPDGNLMLFNDGLGSIHAPPGESPGESRTFSAVSVYAIDSTSQTAAERWRFDYGQSIYSPICSSAYRTADGSVLISYATADGSTHARLVGLDPQQAVVFDLQYDTSLCATSWSAMPVPLEGLTFQ